MSNRRLSRVTAERQLFFDKNIFPLVQRYCGENMRFKEKIPKWLRNKITENDSNSVGAPINSRRTRWTRNVCGHHEVVLYEIPVTKRKPDKVRPKREDRIKNRFEHFRSAGTAKNWKHRKRETPRTRHKGLNGIE